MLEGLPRPLRDQDGEPFWAGLDEGRLLLPRCPRCSAHRWPPGPACPACGAPETEWVESPGRGVVYSWVVVHVAFAEALAGQLPYAVGLVALDEGVRLVCTIDAEDPATIYAGMPVTARVEPADGGDGRLTFIPA